MRKVLIAILLTFCNLMPEVRAQEPQSCEADPAYRTLDFWLGDWDVLVEGKKVGTNRIEKMLKGCAIIENWTDAGGNEGKSLFYYQKMIDKWSQVWVTENAMTPGGVKEKYLTMKLEDGGLRFQGAIPLQGGRSYIDRTTLTPLKDGRVRQVIEVSRNKGMEWETVFDAIYVRKKQEAK